MSNDFKHARIKLIAIYLAIVAGVIALFSCLILYQASDSFHKPAVITGQNLVLNADEALRIAQAVRPASIVSDTEYEIEEGALYFTVTFADDIDVKVDMLSGEAHIPAPPAGMLAALTDDFDERVGWIALFVFFVAALACTYVANNTLQPIARSIKMQKQFVSSAAHELRNPLSALHARIESVLRGPSSGADSSVLRDLLGETKHLIYLSEGLLALEKGEQRTRHLESQSPNSAVSRTFERLEELAKEKDIALIRDIGPELLTIDAEDLEIILFNLIHNAIKFTREKGTVTVSWRAKVLTVADTGVGIAAGEIPHIFDRFYKADTARSEEGSGLGLALVNDIALRYGTKVEVASVVEKGSVFSIHFA